MATQYTTILKLALPTQGELDGSWGTTVNNNITSMVEEAVAGRSVINTWSSNSHTLTTANGTTAEARAAMLSLTDTGDQLGSNAATVICPAASKIYIVTNAVGQAATLKTASGTGIAIPNGATMLLFCDGTNVVEGINNVTGTLTTAAITASGAITSTGDITAAGTLNVTGDTAAGDDAAIGYTSAEGLILTGQGSTSDITVKNDADATVFTVPTGTDDILFPDNAKAIWGAGSDLQVYHDASHSYIVDNGTGNLKIQGTQIDLLGSGETMATFVDDGAATLYYDDSAKIATASGGVAVTGDLTTTGTVEPAGDTAAGDNAAIGYTSAEGLILTGQGSTSDVTIKNDADGDVIKIATGTTTVTMTGDATVGDDLTLLSDSAVLGFGADTDTTLTHTDGSGLTLNSTNKLMFNDASQFIQGSSGTVLSLGATDEIDLTATTIDINGAVALNGAITGATDITLSGELDAATLDISGNADIDGTTNLDAVDIDGAVQIDNTVTVGVDDTGYDVKFFGATASRYLLWDESADSLLFPDSTKAVFGTGSDLEIYHNGSNSIIKEGGAGDLQIGADGNIVIKNAALDETKADFTSNGGVTLYYDNSTKFATTSVGATVTGTLIATTDTDTSNTGSVTLDFAANQNFVLTFTGNVTLANPSTEQVGQSGIICCIQDGTGSRTLSLGTDYETAGGAGITLSTAANSVDIIPYFVKASGSIQLGAVQLAFS